MNWMKLGLAFEALLFGAPVTLIAFAMLPMLYVAIAMASPTFTDGIKGALLLVGSLLALIQYWQLAHATVSGQRYKFGVLFWLAIPGAIIAGLQLIQAWSNPTASLLVITPIVLATFHFSYLQLKSRSA